MSARVSNKAVVKCFLSSSFHIETDDKNIDSRSFNSLTRNDAIAWMSKKSAGNHFGPFPNTVQSDIARAIKV